MHVTLEPLGDGLDALGAQWRELEQRADASFFVSWTWIGSWLASLARRSDMLVLRVRQGPRLVALATFGPARVRRRLFVRSQALFLNEVGSDEFDQLTIEYNAILADRSCGAGALHAAAAFLRRQRQHWNEIYLHATHQPGAGFHASRDLDTRSWTKPAPRVLLERVREGAGDYVALLPRGPRSKVRRSARLYESLGPLEVEVAADAGTAHRTLAALIELHTRYWRRRGEPGAFATEFVRGFHARLVDTGLARGEVQLLTLRAGARCIGCLYNFVHRGHVYNYQSGFDYELFDGRDTPGLVTHAQAVALNAGLGHAVYDFMAGDDRYKRELSTEIATLHWSVLQRRTAALRVENQLRSWRQRWLRR